MADCKISTETAARVTQHWPDILGEIAAGELVRDALKRAGVSYGMIRAYIQGDAQRRKEWEDAREESADAFLDEAMGVARGSGDIVRDDKDAIVYGKDGQPLIIRPDAALARVRVDTLKWAARIRNPRAYSDKAQLDVNVRTVDLTRIISEANARLAGRAPRILEAELVPDMARLAQLM